MSRGERCVFKRVRARPALFKGSKNSVPSKIVGHEPRQRNCLLLCAARCSVSRTLVECEEGVHFLNDLFLSPFGVASHSQGIRNLRVIRMV